MSRPLSLAVPTRCFPPPLREALRAAANTLATGVQIDARDEFRPGELGDTGRREFLRRLGETGLQVASLTFPTRRAYYDREQLELRVEATRAAMQSTWDLKARVLTIRPGTIPADRESPDYAVLRDVLADLARHGNHVGVTLALTPTADSPDTLLALLDKIKSGPLGIDFDPAGFLTAGHPPDQAFRLLYRHVIHFQARDAVRDLRGGQETPLGRGEVDWLALLPLLHEAEYGGWVTAVRTTGEDPAGDVTRALVYINRLQFGG